MPTEVRAKAEITLRGIAASQGIAYGQIFLFVKNDVEVPAYQVDLEKGIDEVARFDHALLITRQQIQKIQAEVEKNLGSDEARIFDAHLLVLEDQALIAETIRDFELTRQNIEMCFDRIAQRYIKAFANIDDEYLRERAGDIRDVAQRVLQNLMGGNAQDIGRLVGQRVIVANDISPSDAASIDRSQALGMVTDSGSKTSHAVIVARSMKIPAVVGLRDLSDKVTNADWALIDGYEGHVIINPTEQTLFRYGKIQLQKKSYEQRLFEANRLPTVTLDDVTVTLRANIERSNEIALAKEYRADSVGLLRTEFLYLSAAEMPSEEVQYQEYKAVAVAFAPEPVVIRTLDLGGDKPMAGNAHLFPNEDNPFLGYRAIRFCLDNVDVFKKQLRAILRASAHGNVQLMYPMISGRDELARANAILDECKSELAANKTPFNPDLEVGAMIEIPSAALTADALARDCAFFSIGTNDLIQYLLAIDRVNDRIAHLYEPTHPAVLRTLKMIVDAAHRRKIKVSVCGEMAGDPVYTALLLGIGVDELSLTPPLIPAVRFLVRGMKMAEARKLASEVLEMESSKEIYARCADFCSERLKTV